MLPHGKEDLTLMARINKDWIDIYFDYGVDKQNRRIFLLNDIDEESIGMVIKGLYSMDIESTERPIKLFIGSLGGSDYEMLALYDVIHTLKSPVHTIAVGKCLSAAPLLVACGAKGHRFATPNTWFMVHQASDDFGNRKLGALEKEFKHMLNMERQWETLMAKHTNQSSEFWRKHCQNIGDKFFSAKQAKVWGLIDHIWDEKEGDDVEE